MDADDSRRPKLDLTASAAPAGPPPVVTSSGNRVITDMFKPQPQSQPQAVFSQAPTQPQKQQPRVTPTSSPTKTSVPSPTKSSMPSPVKSFAPTPTKSPAPSPTKKVYFILIESDEGSDDEFGFAPLPMNLLAEMEDRAVHKSQPSPNRSPSPQTQPTGEMENFSQETQGYRSNSSQDGSQPQTQPQSQSPNGSEGEDSEGATQPQYPPSAPKRLGRPPKPRTQKAPKVNSPAKRQLKKPATSSHPRNFWVEGLSVFGSQVSTNGQTDADPWLT